MPDFEQAAQPDSPDAGRSSAAEHAADSGGARAAVAEGKPKVDPKKRPRSLPPYHVVLLDDNDHSYEYVMEMLRVLFAHPYEEGFRLARQVDAGGRAVVFTTHKELAELKRDQIHAYGIDVRVATCQGSMTAVIEPAEDVED